MRQVPPPQEHLLGLPGQFTGRLGQRKAFQMEVQDQGAHASRSNHSLASRSQVLRRGTGSRRLPAADRPRDRREQMVCWTAALGVYPRRFASPRKDVLSRQLCRRFETRSGHTVRPPSGRIKPNAGANLDTQNRVCSRPESERQRSILWTRAAALVIPLSARSFSCALENAGYLDACQRLK